MKERHRKVSVRGLQSALNEKDVENLWRGFMSDFYKCDIVSPCKCDGYLKSEDKRILCEFKYGTDFKSDECYTVIGQSIHYIKKFLEDGLDIPNVIFIGDKDECFVIPVSSVMVYVRGDYDWSLSPSDAGRDVRLLSALKKDDGLTPFIFEVGEGFNWLPVNDYIERLIRQQKADISITEKTIPKAYDYWKRNVVKVSDDDNRNIEIFFKVLTKPSDCYIHPKKDGVLIVGDEEIRIKSKGYRGFFSLYKENHNPEEVRNLTANKDRLITEVSRRRTGAFFTPSDWVDEAHKMLSEHLGEDWKNEYVVWDCSCGTGNLTRDYRFKELYMSTLEETDIKIIQEAGYNPEAEKFVFDFLNDGFDKLPLGLKEALESGKKIVFFNNPPYSTAQIKGRQGESKRDVATQSKVYDDMNKNHIGGASQNLYAQFMYRIMETIKDYNLNLSVMATFSKSNFMTGKQFKGFRKELESLEFVDGMYFQAIHFSDVSDAWGIAFSIFREGSK